MTETMTTPTFPTIHINGTGADDLFEQYANAAGTIRQALRDIADQRDERDRSRPRRNA